MPIEALGDPNKVLYGRQTNNLYPDSILAGNVVYNSKMILDNPKRFGLEEHRVRDCETNIEEKSLALAGLYVGTLAAEISRSVGYEFANTTNGMTRELALMAKDYGAEGRMTVRNVSKTIASQLSDPESVLSQAIQSKATREAVWGGVQKLSQEIQISYGLALMTNAEELGIDLAENIEANNIDPEARLFNPLTSRRYIWAREQNPE